jgi:hypothetical protein
MNESGEELFTYFHILGWFNGAAACWFSLRPATRQRFISPPSKANLLESFAGVESRWNFVLQGGAARLARIVAGQTCRLCCGSFTDCQQCPQLWGTPH